MTPNPKANKHGVPLCSQDLCPKFDGKRFGLCGSRLDSVCEPAVQALVEAARLVVFARREGTRNLGSTLPLTVAQAIDALARQVGEPDGPAPLQPAGHEAEGPPYRRR